MEPYDPIKEVWMRHASMRERELAERVEADLHEEKPKYDHYRAAIIIGYFIAFMFGVRYVVNYIWHNFFQ